MRKVRLLFIVVTGVSLLVAQQSAAQTIGLRQQSASGQEAAIHQISSGWIRFYDAGDAEKVAALYTEDGCYLSAHVPAQGKKAIKAYWDRGIQAGGHVNFIKPLTLYHSGGLACFAGTCQAINSGVTVDGRILIVLRKVNGKSLTAAHQTVVSDQPL